MSSAETINLKDVIGESIAQMSEVMKQSIGYQNKITEVTTYLGQVAARAAKQTPQG
jgi:hypothetical protein